MHSSLRDVSLNPANEVTFMTTALAMVSAGLGVTVCLPYAEPLVRLHQLHMRQLHEPELTRRFFVYRRQNRSLSPWRRASSPICSSSWRPTTGTFPAFIMDAAYRQRHPCPTTRSPSISR
ncbi:LysR substrate-binding domain-containing protein [Massilia sp. H-1]|nr:LysR substrate-binding domain-containing protein [Massilia sp. H-1]